MAEGRGGRFFRFWVLALLAALTLEFFVALRMISDSKNLDGNVAVVALKGPIDDSSKVIAELKKYEQRKSVKAIVLRVDSPGGTVGASQEIHDEVERIAKERVLVVSMGDVAASGGYYASVPADKIVANPGTITGSIGVIMTFFVVGDLLKKAYLKWDVIYAGEIKDLGSTLRQRTPEEKAILEALARDVHEQFIEAVADGRQLPIARVRSLATGGIYSGKQAKVLGLVDELGSLEYAIRLAARMAKIDGEPDPIYPEKERFQWLKALTKLTAGLFSSLHMGYELYP